KWAVRPKNNKVPRYVKKQCAVWLKIADGKDKEAYIDEDVYRKLLKVLKLMVHPDLLSQMDECLEPYAMFMITAVFCTKLKNKENFDIRYYTTAILKIARKNFKTFNAGVIFILLMLTEPRFSRFFSVAPDLKLSKELQGAIKKIIKSSPVFFDEFDPAFETLRSEVRCLLTESEYTPLAYSEDRMDGKLANAFLADEAGAMDSYPVEAMRSSQITLLNKLGIIISTEYPNDNNVMIDETDKAKKALDGLRKNKRIFALIYEPDDDLLQDDQWMTNDLVIYQSNPVAVTNRNVFEAIADLRSDAIDYENKRENYLCKHNNIKYKSLGVEGYVDIIKVRACKKKKDAGWWKGRRVWLGLDLSLSEDNVCVNMETYEGDDTENCELYSKTFGFIPAGKVELKSRREDVDYKKLIKDGCCFACGDEVVSYNFIEKFILSLPDEYGVEIVQRGYDKWNAISTIQKMEEHGIECVEIKQHSSVLHSPTKLLKEKILSKKYHYEENLMLEINFQNARCTEDTNKNKYVNKKKSAGKVDQVVGNINSTYLIEQEILYGMENFGAQVI
ncbi:MAG: terminase, partial [Lachnospiraceae bacterium]|nr:terminase [Lachnospiraceae bacterium]